MNSLLFVGLNQRVLSNVAIVWRAFSATNLWVAKIRPECVPTELVATLMPNASDPLDPENTVARYENFYS